MTILEHMNSISINSTAELGAVAQQLLAFAEGYRFFIFEGDMAAGKTTFIKAFCEALGVSEVVSSPTFSIVNEYEAAETLIYHFDFYRLKNLQEAYDIGYEDYFYSNAVCLVEWPTKVEELLPESYIKIDISITGENARHFGFTKIG
jgi:tRNA threonylcarbamoyladenosine biosynthesis protein TsaE